MHVHNYNLPRLYELQLALLDVEPISVRLDGLARPVFIGFVTLPLLSVDQKRTVKFRRATKLPTITCHTEENI